jgi:hypothetical protein
MTTSVQLTYSLVVLFLPNPQPKFYSYVNDFFMKYNYLDPCDHGGH